MKLQTPVDTGRSKVSIGYGNSIVLLGSCFADSIGSRLTVNGFDALVNPFGTLYNPSSVRQAADRLKECRCLSQDDVVQLGSGLQMFGSFSHHTLAAAPTPEEFLEKANDRLSEASAFWQKADRVIVTLGTSWCYRHNERGLIVSNCLKRPAAEFSRIFMDTDESAEILTGLVHENPDKEFIFTVSPVRHLKDGAHGNNLSKSALLLAVDKVVKENPENAEYFPSYEILADELRDYRFYAEDMVHPSEQAAQYIFERFIDWAMPKDEMPTFEEKHKEHIRSRHRPMLGQ